MGFSCGIVGLPNVGKSTLFNALTRAHAPAENYPFCTIDPNVGAVSVPDRRLKRLAEIFNPKKVTSTQVSFVDIAGLVKGASQGEGLGNQFLSHIRDCDAIAMVVRCFEKTDVTHVAGSVDPLRDIQIIDTELMLKDLDSVEKIHEKTRKRANTGDKAAILEAGALDKAIRALQNGTPLRKLDWEPAERTYLKSLALISVKPLMLVANAGEENLTQPDRHVTAVLEYARQENVPAVHLSLKIEAEIIELPESEQAEFLRSLGLSEPGLHVFIRAGYRLLDLQTFLTGGPDEVRAWTFVRGMKAPQCAGVIHSDFEKGFIKAEVYRFEDIDRLGSELSVREKGLLRQEGKDYVMQDGDVVFFKFNV